MQKSPSLTHARGDMAFCAGKSVRKAAILERSELFSAAHCGIIGRIVLKRESDMNGKHESQNLQFDHLAVKLAVLHHLIYVRDILPLPAEFEACTTEQERLTCLAEYDIPSYMGGYVQRLDISREDELYDAIAPDGWSGEDARFFVQEISLREAKQFPHLREIRFDGMTNNGKAIAKTLKPLDIFVTETDPNAKPEKTVPLVLTIALFVLCSVLGGWLLTAQVQAHNPPVPEEEVTVERVIPKPIERHLIYDVLVEHDPNIDRMRLLDKEGHPYCNWLPWVKCVNAHYFLVALSESVYGLFDIETKDFIALPQYRYVSSCMLTKDGQLLPQSGILVSNNGKAWYLITSDYTETTPVDMQQISDTSGAFIVDCSAETPVAYSVLDVLETLEPKGGE